VVDEGQGVPLTFRPLKKAHLAVLSVGGHTVHGLVPYVLRRVAQAVPLLLGIVVVTFCLIHSTSPPAIPP
jgi:hypothetical protein